MSQVERLVEKSDVSTHRSTPLHTRRSESRLAGGWRGDVRRVGAGTWNVVNTTALPEAFRVVLVVFVFETANAAIVNAWRVRCPSPLRSEPRIADVTGVHCRRGAARSRGEVLLG